MSETPRQQETPPPLGLAVNGVLGRVGRVLVRLAHEAGCRVVAAYEHRGHARLGATLEEVGLVEPGAPGAEVAVAAVSSAGIEPRAAVCVDFSLPEGLAEVVAACRRSGCALVSGTTGLAAEQEALLAEAATEIAVLHATNFSLGVALLVRLAEQAARALGPEFELEVVEAHHGRKVDAPSGTALTLAHALAEARGRRLAEVARHGRQGVVGERESHEIGLHAVRGGSVVGEHTVHFLGPEERLELTHRAASREIFVRGALHTARWIQHKPPGRYAIADVVAGGPGEPDDPHHKSA